jgi:hypothetical protein
MPSKKATPGVIVRLPVLHKGMQGVGNARDGAWSLGRQALDRIEVVLETPLVEIVVLPAGVVCAVVTDSGIHVGSMGGGN